MTTIRETIKNLLEAIATEAQRGKNTAARIGSALVRMFDYTNSRIDSINTSINYLSETVGQLEAGEGVDTSTFVRRAELTVKDSEFYVNFVQSVTDSLGENEYVTQGTFRVTLEGLESTFSAMVDGKLGGYATGQDLREVSSKFTQTAEEIQTQVNGISKDYITSAALTLSNNKLLSDISKKYVTPDGLQIYATKSQLEQTEEKIGFLVSVDEGGGYSVKGGVFLDLITDVDAEGNRVFKSSFKIDADRIEIGKLAEGIEIGGFRIQGTALAAEMDTAEGAHNVVNMSPESIRMYSRSGTTVRYTDVTPESLEITTRPMQGGRGVQSFYIDSKGNGILADGAISWEIENGVVALAIDKEKVPYFKILEDRIRSIEQRLDTFIDQYNAVHDLTNDAS